MTSLTVLSQLYIEGKVAMVMTYLSGTNCMQDFSFALSLFGSSICSQIISMSNPNLATADTSVCVPLLADVMMNQVQPASNLLLDFFSILSSTFFSELTHEKI
jgi:hypothetical protein